MTWRELPDQKSWENEADVVVTEIEVFDRFGPGIKLEELELSTFYRALDEVAKLKTIKGGENT